MLEKAIEIAQEAHKKQTDKAGEPYIGHLMRVMQSGTNEDEKICGVLHDLIEDTDWTFEKLAGEGFSDHIIEALKCLSKDKNEDYDDFIDRVLSNPLAIKVKINDLTDNMDIKRLKEVTKKDKKRLKKYFSAYQRLIECNIR